MTNIQPTTPTAGLRPAAIAAAFVLIAAFATPGHAAGQWSTVGSVGVPDESGYGFYMDRGMVATSSTSSTAYSHFRYPITPIDVPSGAVADHLDWEMSITYNDNGPSGRVLMYIQEVPLVPPSSAAARVGRTIWGFSSNNAEGFKRGYRSLVCPHQATGGGYRGEGFDFANNAYFLEVNLWKSGSDGIAQFYNASLEPVYYPEAGILCPSP